jgi:hypothetical protein
MTGSLVVSFCVLKIELNTGLEVNSTKLTYITVISMTGRVVVSVSVMIILL